MIVADIISNLGNQLFSYAATKCIALDLNRDYRYRVIRPTNALHDHCIDANGHEYRRDFEHAFHVDVSERIEELPADLQREWTWSRLPDSSFNPEVYHVGPKAHLKGYFLSPKYFLHHANTVRQWFCLRDEYRAKGIERLRVLKKGYSARYFVSVHVRLGDFRRWGLAIDIGYQLRAMGRMSDLLGSKDICFLLFSDGPDPILKALQRREYNFVQVGGSVFEDLCLMTLCDANIVSNSTLSWWGGWLYNFGTRPVIHPSIYLLSRKEIAPADIYLPGWHEVDAEREKESIPTLLRRWWEPQRARCSRILSRGTAMIRAFK